MISEYLNYLSSIKACSEYTARAYRSSLISFVSYMMSNKIDARWSNISRKDVESYICYMVSCEKQPTTIKRHKAAILGIFRYMMHMGYIQESDVFFAQSPKLHATEPNIIDYKDINATIDDANIDTDTRTIILIIAETGLRISEVLSLRPLDFDKANKMITISGKGSKLRHCYYSNRIADMLNKYYRYTKRCNNLFEGNERVIRKKIWMALHKHSNAIKTSPHILRHSFATQMISNGMSLINLQGILGHSDITTTRKYINAQSLSGQKEYNNAISAMA